MTDPAFWIDGLPDPFNVYFSVLIHNGHDAQIFVGAQLQGPPGGWTDGGEDDLGSVNMGENLYAEKDNVTRAVMATPANETVVCRFNYYTDVVGGSLLGYDDLSFDIYWESIAAGTIDATDNFGIDLDSWVHTIEAGEGTVYVRSSYHSMNGVYCSAVGESTVGSTRLNDLEVSRLRKTVVMGAGTRAYIFGFVKVGGGQWNQEGDVVMEIVSPVETLELPYLLHDGVTRGAWRRFGVRLNPGASNEVTIRGSSYGVGSQFEVDFIRWVRY